MLMSSVSPPSDPAADSSPAAAVVLAAATAAGISVGSAVHAMLAAAADAISAVMPCPCFVGRTSVAAVVIADQYHEVAAAAAATTVVISARLPHADAGCVVDTANTSPRACALAPRRQPWCPLCTRAVAEYDPTQPDHALNITPLC